MTRAFSPPRKQPKHRWTESELQIMRDRYPDIPTANLANEMGISINSMNNCAYIHGIKKSHAYLSAVSREKNHGVKTQFKPGQTPFNKGIKGWKAGGRSAETQFKPGQSVANHRPVGSTRITVDGYIEIKIEEPRKWAQMHRVVWKENHGSYPPAGMALVFKDGNKQNCTIGNLEVITRSALMLRNSYHQYGTEISALVQLRGVVSRQINRRSQSNV